MISPSSSLVPQTMTSDSSSLVSQIIVGPLPGDPQIVPPWQSAPPQLDPQTTFSAPGLPQVVLVHNGLAQLVPQVPHPNPAGRTPQTIWAVPVSAAPHWTFVDQAFAVGVR